MPRTVNALGSLWHSNLGICAMAALEDSQCRAFLFSGRRSCEPESATAMTTRFGTHKGKPRERERKSIWLEHNMPNTQPAMLADVAVRSRDRYTSFPDVPSGIRQRHVLMMCVQFMLVCQNLNHVVVTHFERLSRRRRCASSWLLTNMIPGTIVWRICCMCTWRLVNV